MDHDLFQAGVYLKIPNACYILIKNLKTRTKLLLHKAKSKKVILHYYRIMEFFFFFFKEKNYGVDIA